ncbi:MAG: hypothetical protein ABIE84_00085 [bacterium]
MSKNFLLTILFCSVILLTSCFRETVSEVVETAENNWWPHSDGYSWTYNTAMQIISTDSTYEVNSVSSETWTLQGTTTINNIELQILLKTDGPDDYLLFSGSGVAWYGNSLSVADSPTANLLYPLSEGKKWNVGLSNDITVEVMGIETVQVPAGGFEACLVSIDFGDGAYNHNYYALDVGLVKTVEYFSDIVMTSSDGLSLTHATYISTKELASKNF